MSELVYLDYQLRHNASSNISAIVLIGTSTYSHPCRRGCNNILSFERIFDAHTVYNSQYYSSISITPVCTEKALFSPDFYFLSSVGMCYHCLLEKNKKSVCSFESRPITQQLCMQPPTLCNILHILSFFMRHCHRYATHAGLV